MNKLYLPVPDFQLCVFHDGNIYFDKIKRLATARPDPDNPRAYLLKRPNSGRDYERDSKASVNSNMEFIFKDHLLRIGHLKVVNPKKVNTLGPLAGTTAPTKAPASIKEEEK